MKLNKQDKKELRRIDGKLKEPWRTWTFSEVEFLRNKLYDLLVKMVVSSSKSR